MVLERLGLPLLTSKSDEIAKILNIPEGITQTVMFPAAYTLGAVLSSRARKPAEDLIYWNSWDNITQSRPSKFRHILELRELLKIYFSPSISSMAGREKASVSQTKEIDIPAEPARPVRPILCT